MYHVCVKAERLCGRVAYDHSFRGLAVRVAIRVHIVSLSRINTHAHTHTHTHTQDDIFADQHVGPVFNDDGMFSCVANVLLMCC